MYTMFTIMLFVILVIFCFGFLLDISINLRRLNNNIKKLIK
jgi:hypothetical protein